MRMVFRLGTSGCGGERGHGRVEVWRETSVQLESGVELRCGLRTLSYLKTSLIDRFIPRTG